ncbi:hypothetical protein GLYMA_01G080450v4 [Glycine max]|nr:hypothetical protein GLYMA_01G080450v4 [Glycine max]KAH1162154.1 hypothetical protein GYH30_000864 [Glycine max]
MDPYCVKKVELMRCYDEKDVRDWQGDTALKGQFYLFLHLG